MAAVDRASIRNDLLNTLPADALDLVVPSFQRVVLEHRATLHAAYSPLTHVFFPEEGYASLLVHMEEGDISEVRMVGREGMIGLPLAFETDHSPMEAMVQSPGTALQMEAAVFRRLVAEVPAFGRMLKRYAMAFQVQLSLTAACNSRHLIEQRLARWLLMAHDRVDRDDFPMTHEFLSMMLGVRRASVSVAAKGLQQAGLIGYEQGRIRVTDRPGLEAAACECHGAVSREYDRLLGKHPHK
jgi:CRP-like cAMP-binding protein